MRGWFMVMVVSAGCGQTVLVPQGPTDDDQGTVTSGDPTDGTETTDETATGETDATSTPSDPTDTATSDTGDTATSTTETVLADCSAIAAADSDWDVCVTDATRCEATFTDGAGCDLVCAMAGLACVAAYDNIDGECAADGSSAVDCASGHQSDYCVCEGAAPPIDECSSYPLPAHTLLADRMGFGANTTGGDPNNVYRVTTLADTGAGSLRDALESTEDYWIVFDVEGEIELSSGRIDIQSDKTIDGRDRDITIRGELRMTETENVIFADLKLTNDLEGHCTQDGDVVGLRGPGGPDPSDFTTRNVWFHHVEFFNGGDGLLDMRGATEVTVSWSHFHSHEKGLLLGSDMDDEPTAGMHLTFHHNWFEGITKRGPRVIHGKAHFFNNYQLDWYEYGVASVDGAELLSENNIYQARPGTVCVTPCPDPNPCGDNDFFVSKEATTIDWAAPPGNLKSVGDAALEGAVIVENNPSDVFDPADHYSYTAEPATYQLGLDLMDATGPRDDICP